MRESTINKIREFLNESSGEEVLQIVQEINGMNGSLEELYWEYMDCFDELNSGISPHEIARRCFYGDFCPAHNYWRYNAYANFESCDFISYDEYDIEEIIEAIQYIHQNYLPSIIQEIIEEEGDEN